MMPELVGMCRNRVTVAPYSSRDAYGTPSYGAAVSYAGRLTGERKLVISSCGEQVMCGHVFYFAGAPNIGAHDLLTLSTGDVNSTETGVIQPTVISIKRIPDDLGRVSVIAYLR